MSDFVMPFTITVPANTPNAVVTDTPLGICNVTKIILVVPPGPSGLVGVQFQTSYSAAYPTTDDGYFVFDDYTYEQAVAGQINSGQWSVAAYNNDVNDHTIQVYYHCDYVHYSPALAASQPIGL